MEDPWMNKRILKIVSLFAILIIVAACNLPTGSPARTPDLQATVAAEVAVAQAAQTMVAGTLAAGGVAQSVERATDTLAAPPETTFTPTLTSTITLTPTPEGVFLTLSSDTYCRTGGPYSAFKAVTTVRSGVRVEVLARNPEFDSYLVKNPNAPNTTCWLWGQYATLTGNTAGLPVATTQPTPTHTLTPTPDANFTVNYVQLENCLPLFAFKLKVTNTGGTIWQSIVITGSDSNTGFVIQTTGNTFKEYAGCNAVLEQGDLTPGEWSYVLNVDGGSFFGYNPTGHLIMINVKMCSQDNLMGVCKSIPLSFTP